MKTFEGGHQKFSKNLTSFCSLLMDIMRHENFNVSNTGKQIRYSKNQ